MTGEQLERLTQRLEYASPEQPDMLLLRQKLLSLGGTELVVPPEFDSDLSFVINAGYLMPGAVVEEVLQSRACHQNVAELWRQGKLTGIGTGYALSGELWRQHSWGLRTDCIVETTVTRIKYFGFLLTSEKADHFAALNPPE
jgi:hypothetical protein